MKKWLFSILAILLAVSFYLPLVSAEQVNDDALGFGEHGSGQKADLAEESANQLVVFKDQQIPAGVTDLLAERFPEVEVTQVMEIGMLKLHGSRRVTEAVDELEREFGDAIDSIGPEQKLTVPSLPQVDKLANSATDRLGVNAFSRNAAPIHDSFRRPERPDPGEEVSVTDAVYYEWFGWDIQKVTDDGKSFEIETGNHKVKIAVIDSGIDFHHPDLQANIISSGRSFVPGVSDTQDRMGHGTMTAGAIAANGAMLGVGPNLGLVPYKVMENAEDGAESAWVIQAIIQAAIDGADVINVSLGTYKSLRSLEDRVIVKAYELAVKFAAKRGAIVVASAGNDGLDLSDPAEVAEKRGYPGDRQVHLPGAGVKEAITVSATNKQDELALYSNYGKGITLAAPGGDFGPDFYTEGILDPFELAFSTYPTTMEPPVLNQMLGLPHGYTLNAGTSMAVPKVSGAVGVLIAHQKELGGKPLNVNQIKQLLRKGAVEDRKGSDQYFGFGHLNVYHALKEMDKAPRDPRESGDGNRDRWKDWDRWKDGKPWEKDWDQRDKRGPWDRDGNRDREVWMREREIWVKEREIWNRVDEDWTREREIRKRERESWW